MVDPQIHQTKTVGKRGFKFIGHHKEKPLQTLLLHFGDDMKIEEEKKNPESV